MLGTVLVTFLAIGGCAFYGCLIFISIDYIKEILAKKSYEKGFNDAYLELQAKYAKRLGEQEEEEEL